MILAKETRDKRRYPKYTLKDGRLVKVEPEPSEWVIQTSEEAVRKGFEKAPHTISGLFGGGVIGALIAGPLGALIGGALMGFLGYCADQQKNQK